MNLVETKDIPPSNKLSGQKRVPCRAIAGCQHERVVINGVSHCPLTCRNDVTVLRVPDNPWTATHL
jgi:hypothetical protein